MTSDVRTSVTIGISKAGRSLVVTQGDQRIVLDMNTANQLDMDLLVFPLRDLGVRIATRGTAV